MVCKNILYVMVTVACLGLAGCIDSEQSNAVDGGWSIREGFDKSWLYQDSATAWEPLSLPGPFVIKAGSGKKPKTVTVRCCIDSLLVPYRESGKSVSFRSGRGVDVVTFYLDTLIIGQVGSLTPYEPGIDYEFVNVLPPHAITTDGPHYLTVVYHASNGVGFFGMRTLPRIGFSYDINREYYKGIIVGFFFLGIFGVIALYHLVLGVMRIKDTHNLYFGLFSTAFTLFVSANTPVRNVLYFNSHFLVEHLDLLSAMLITAILPLFISQLITGRIYRAVKVYFGFILILLFPVLCGDLAIGLFIRRVWEATLPVPIVGVFVLVAYHAWRGNYEARVVGSGFVIFVIAAVHDLFAFKGAVEFSLLMPAAFVLFVLGVAVLLIKRFVFVHNKIEQLNEELEDRVVDRTKELQRSIKEKDRILGVVAHDLRNPVSAIKISTDILSIEFEKKETSSTEECLRIINDAVSQSLANIDTLLSMSKLDDSSSPLSTEKVDLCFFLQSFFSLYDARAKEKQITFTHTIVSGTMMVAINKSMFTRVIDNLLSNAIKFTPEHGTISLDAVPLPNAVLITIADSGIGIPDKFKESVFLRFGPAARLGTNNERSTGLGLSIVKTVVERHGGTVRLESKEGYGTTFYVEIPYENGNEL